MPEYLFPPDSEMDASVIDTEVVREVCEVRTSCVRCFNLHHTVTLAVYDLLQKCNVTEADVQHALLSGDPQDQIAIAYNLIIDNKRFYDEG